MFPMLNLHFNYNIGYLYLLQRQPLQLMLHDHLFHMYKLLVLFHTNLSHHLLINMYLIHRIYVINIFQYCLLLILFQLHYQENILEENSMNANEDVKNKTLHHHNKFFFLLNLFLVALYFVIDHLYQKK